MARLAGVTRHLVGVGAGQGEPPDPGPFTARGVIEGMKAALRARTASPELDGRFVLVQGAGDVGAPLARELAAEGARVLVTDVDGERAGGVADDVGGRVVAPGDAWDVECDVFAPCADGGVPSAATIPHLRCRIVAGAATGQLQRREDAERLRQRGILYAPDYVISGGGAAILALAEFGEGEAPDVDVRLAAIGTTLDEIFEEAAERSVSPLECAEARVRDVLSRGRREVGEVTAVR